MCCGCGPCGLSESELSERDLVLRQSIQDPTWLNFCPTWPADSDVGPWPGCLTRRYGWGMGPWYGSPVSRWCFFCALWLSDFSSMSRQSLAVVWWVASFNNDRPFHSHTTGGGMAYLVVEMLPSFSFHPSNQTFTLLLKISTVGVPSSAA